MSQNVTLHAAISPRQSLAAAALAGGSTVTEAAEKAGVARETVSRWLHRDAEFIAELQNFRAELAIQRRFRKLRFTSRGQWVRNVVVRGGYRLVPERIRRIAYRMVIATYRR